MEDLTELKRLISISYGIQDLIFAGHNNDIEAGQKALIEAFSLELGFEEYLELHREFLLSKGVHSEHLNEQLENVKDLSRYFTQD